MGVPPEKVADVMALMGDSIDNIPGAKGIGEKGARELILPLRLGRSGPRPCRRSRRQALSRSAAQLAANKCCSRSSSPPSPPTLPSSSICDALDAARARLCRAARPLRRAGLHLAAADLPAATTRLARSPPTTPRSIRPPRSANFCDAQPRDQPDRRLAHARCRRARNRRLRRARRRLRAFAAAGRRAFRLVRRPAEMLAALREFLADPQRPKIVHDPKLIELARRPVARRPPRHHALFLSCCGPPPRSTTSPTVVLRHLNVTLSGAAGEHADHLAAPGSAAAPRSRSAGTRRRLRTNRPAARARARRHGAPRHSRRSRRARGHVRRPWKAKSAPSSGASGNWAAANSTSIRRSNSPKSSSTS